MRTRVPSVYLAVLTFILMHSSIHMVLADARSAELAKAEYQQGKSCLENRSFECADEHFTKSYEYYPKDLVLFDISQARDGFCRKLLGAADYDIVHRALKMAISSYDRFLDSTACKAGKEPAICEKATLYKARLSYQFALCLRGHKCDYVNHLGAKRFELSAAYFESAMSIFDSEKYGRAADGWRELALLYAKLNQCKRARERFAQYERSLNSFDRREATKQKLFQAAETELASCKEPLVAEFAPPVPTNFAPENSAAVVSVSPRGQPEIARAMEEPSRQTSPQPADSGSVVSPPSLPLRHQARAEWASPKNEGGTLGGPAIPRYLSTSAPGPSPLAQMRSSARTMRKAGIALVAIGGVALATGGIIGISAYGLETNVAHEYQQTGIWTTDLQYRTLLAQHTWPVSYYTAGAGGGLILLGGILWGSGNSLLRP